MPKITPLVLKKALKLRCVYSIIFLEILELAILTAMYPNDKIVKNTINTFKKLNSTG